MCHQNLSRKVCQFIGKNILLTFIKWKMSSIMRCSRVSTLNGYMVFSSIKWAELVLVREGKCWDSATRTTAGDLAIFAEDLTIPAQSSQLCLHLKGACYKRLEAWLRSPNLLWKKDSVPESCPWRPHYTSHPPLPHTYTHSNDSRNEIVGLNVVTCTFNSSTLKQSLRPTWSTNLVSQFQASEYYL